MNRPLTHRRARPFARPRSEKALRQDWVESLELANLAAVDARALAGGADEAPSGRPGQVLTTLVAKLRDLAPDNFPAPGFAPRVLAAAFLVKARAFVQPTGNAAEVRTLLAASLMAEAGGLEDLLAELRRREARGWQAQLSERGED